MPMRFGLGRLVATPAALAALEKAGQSSLSLLARHATGDWGELCPQDVAANEEALVTGARLMSVYPLADGVTIWVITDAAGDDGHRSCTTVLLPEDY